MLRGRDFLKLMDFKRHEIEYILATAEDLKKKLSRREPHELLRGRTVAIIMEKKSTRTRTSFQAGIAHLGAQGFYMRPDEMQMSRGESIKDTARTIDRYCDALVMRTFGQDRVEEFAKYMDHPVINALTDLTHPCQVLADYMTIKERKGKLEGLKMTYSGDIWCMAHSLMVGAGLFGMKIYLCQPKGYEPNPGMLQFAKERAAETGGEIVLTDDMKEAVKDSDVLYANTYHSMGAAEQEKEKRIRDFSPFQINSQVAKLAKKDYLFMHCMPGYRGEEFTEEILEGPHSVVWDQAENRMHTEKAVLALTMA